MNVLGSSVSVKKKKKKKIMRIGRKSLFELRNVKGSKMLAFGFAQVLELRE